MKIIRIIYVIIIISFYRKWTAKKQKDLRAMFSEGHMQKIQSNKKQLKSIPWRVMLNVLLIDRLALRLFAFQNTGSYAKKPSMCSM